VPEERQYRKVSSVLILFLGVTLVLQGFRAGKAGVLTMDFQCWSFGCVDRQTAPAWKGRSAKFCLQAQWVEQEVPGISRVAKVGAEALATCTEYRTLGSQPSRALQNLPGLACLVCVFSEAQVACEFIHSPVFYLLQFSKSKGHPEVQLNWPKGWVSE
jgi:hypothetical protein